MAEPLPREFSEEEPVPVDALTGLGSPELGRSNVLVTLPEDRSQSSVERDLRLRIEDLSSALDHERHANERLRERLRDVYRHGWEAPYAAFLASEEAETIPRSFWPTLESFLATFPIRLQEGEATRLYQQWDVWNREVEVAYDSGLEDAAAYLWSPEARAIELLGPRRILTELTNEQLREHWTTTERDLLEAVFGSCCPERVAELNAMYPPW